MFHNTAKRSAQYKSKSCVLDLLDGPIISEDDYLSIQHDPDLIESIDIANSEEDIKALQLLYQKK